MSTTRKGQRPLKKPGAKIKATRKGVYRDAILAAPKDAWVLGIDPDCHTSGLALFRDGEPAWVGAARVPAGVKGQACAPLAFRAATHALSRLLAEDILVVVEGQRVRRAAGAETKNPQSLVDLAAVTGALVGAAMSVCPRAEVLVVEPSDWKGSVPKQVHQGRTYSKLGWAYKSMTGYVVPVRPAVLAPGVKDADWKHVGDAVGLALWGHGLLYAEHRRAELLR